MLGKLLAATALYVFFGLVFGGAILWLMYSDGGVLSRVWPLGVVSVAYTVFFMRVGCWNEH